MGACALGAQSRSQGCHGTLTGLPPTPCCGWTGNVGGVWGDAEFLAAIADPKHEEHASFLEWCGGSFSPDKFDPKKATREMKKGLPDWRRM